jgi:hypothetical protein
MACQFVLTASIRVLASRTMNRPRSLNRFIVLPLLRGLAALAFAAASRAEIPENELKLAGAISLTTELLEKMEKFLAGIKSEPAAKAELAAVTREKKDNPPMTGQAWGSLISAKCPKVLQVFEASDLTPEEFGKAALAIQSIMMAEVMAPPGDEDNMAKSDDKTVAANAAFFADNKGRAEVIYGAFSTFGI